MSLKTKTWSLIEQFGGTGIFFITLPFLSNRINETTFAIFLMSQTMISLATIYTGGSALRANKLHHNYNKSFSLSKEAILAAKITTFLSPLVLIYFLLFSFSENTPHIAHADQACIAVIVLFCIFLEIQASTLSILLKIKNIFQGCAVSELVYRISLVILILGLYAINTSPITGALALFIASIAKLCILYAYEIIHSSPEKRDEENLDATKLSSLSSALIYGATSFIVSNGERVFSGILGPKELATVYSVMLLPLFIPSIFNAIRVTALSTIGTINQKSDSESWILASLKEAILIFPIAITIYFTNPIYYSRFSNLDENLNISLINAIACTIAATQALNIKSFYSLIMKAPTVAANIVFFSGAIYLLVGAAFVPTLGIYGILIAKLAFYLGSLTMLPANKY